MIPVKKLFVSLALVAFFQGSSQAQDELLLRDHHHLLRGKVVSSTADSVTFEHAVGETSDTQTFAAADIDPHSFYIIRSHAVGNDAAAKVALGNYCAANGLYTRARNQFIEAQKLDSSLDLKGDINACRKETIKDLLAEATAKAKAGKVAEANALATEIIRRDPTSALADQARGLSKTLHAKTVSERKVKEAAHDAKVEDKAIKRLQAEIHKAADLNQKGLQEKSFSNAQREFKQSIETYKKSLHDLGGAAKEDKESSDLTKLLAQTKNDLIGVYVNLGSIYLTQTNFQEALKEANAALAVDQNSATAKSFRTRVASASADSDVEVYGGGGRIRR